jgi:2'-5' RNA ligase
MRLFLAVELSQDVRDAVAQMRARLQASGADVRWVEPANFHLTVKFIGDQPDGRLPEIEAVCADVAAATPAFRFRVRGAGAFPKRGPLKTLWVGLSEGGDEWKALALRAETPLGAFGVPREGGLVPHITLGRVKSERGMGVLREALAAEAATDCGAQAADRITLMQSTLDPRGAIHTPLREWPLESMNIMNIRSNQVG